MSGILDERNVDFKKLNRDFNKLLQRLRDLGKQPCRLDEVEREVHSLLLNLGRVALEEFVAAAGDGDVGETLEQDDQTLKRLNRKRSRTYRSIFGPITIERCVYAKREKQKHTAPLDRRLGLPAGETSYLLEHWMTSLATEMPYAAVANLLNEVFGIGCGDTTVENRVRKVGEHVESFREEVTETFDDEGELIVALADAKGVPIRTSWEQRLEELGRKPHLRHRKNNYERTPRRMPPGGQAKTQQATVGACYAIERDVRTSDEALNRQQREQQPPKPIQKRTWAEMNCIQDGVESRGAERVFQHLAANIALRNPDGSREVVCLLDGAVSLWKLKKQYLPQAVSIIDIFHVTEKLWDVAHCVEPQSSKAADDRVTHWLRMLLEGKVDYVRGLFQRMLNQQKWAAAKREALQHAIDYLRNNRDAMRYDEYLARGYPIGSGVIEGACKHIIGDRFCRSGMRWEVDGSQPLLSLRTINLDRRWQEFMNHRIKKEQQTLYGLAA